MIRATIFEGQTFYAVARLARAGGDYVTQEDVQDVNAYVYLVAGGNASSAVSSEAVPVEDSIYDTLQTDGFWDGDRLGYNFRMRLRPGAFSVGAALYRVEVIIALYDEDATANDDPDSIPLVYEVTVQELFSSLSKVVHTYKPYGAALDLFRTREPEVLMEGPAGTGKTRAVLEYVNYVCEQFENIRVLLFRKTRASMTESVLVTWEDEVLWTGHPARTGEASRQNRMNYTYPNGSHVVVGGMDNSDRIMSTQYDIICGFEATELTQEDWEKVTTRNRNNQMPWQQCIADCNPGSQYHWLNRRANLGQLKRLLSRHEDNPVYYDVEKGDWTEPGRRYIATLERLSGARRERLLLGLWVSEEGMVYEKWDPRIHVMDRSKLVDETGHPRCHTFFGSIDWGYRAPGVFQVWGVDNDHTMYRVAEIYYASKVFDWWATEITKLVKEYDVFSIVADPAEPRSIEMLNDWLGSVGKREGARIVHKADNDRFAGRDLVDWALKDEEGNPRLFLVDGALRCGRDMSLSDAGHPCSTIEEFPGYVWRKGEDGKPVKEEPDPSCADHGLDALRYAAMFNWGKDWRPVRKKEPHADDSFGALLGHDAMWAKSAKVYR